MKRLVAIIATSLVALTAAPAVGQEVASATATATQTAFARWSAKEDGHRVMYFALGTTGVPGDWVSMGAIARAECRKISHGGHVGWICRGRTEMVQLAPGDFVVDPLLGSAELRIASEEAMNSVTWQGTGTGPIPYVHQHAGNDVGVQVMAMFMRPASIAGEIEGSLVAATRGGMMFEGFDINVTQDEFRTPLGRFAVDDGVVRFRTTIR